MSQKELFLLLVAFVRYFVTAVRKRNCLGFLLDSQEEVPHRKLVSGEPGAGVRAGSRNWVGSNQSPALDQLLARALKEMRRHIWTEPRSPQNLWKWGNGSDSVKGSIG